MHPKILKGLSLGLSFQFFEYLSVEFEFERRCEVHINLFQFEFISIHKLKARC